MRRGFLLLAIVLGASLSARAADDARSARDRAFADIMAGRYEAAVADADAGLKASPDAAALLTLRAEALLRSGRAQAAFADADRAVRLDGHEGLAWLQRGLARRALGEAPNRYLPDLSRAAALDPDLRPAFVSASRAALPWWATPGALTAGVALIILALAAGATVLRSPKPARDASVVGGCFRLGRRLGAGGMGVVFEAWDTNLERAVAVKRMSAALREDPEEARRFVQEAKTVASLKHPNIVVLHDAFQDGAELYLVFELVRGETLADHVERRGGKADWPEALGLLAPIADALDYAHARGVIHRDLKPANVMLEDGIVKVMDFGISRRTKSPDARTMTSRIAGTPGFMAPELQRGDVSRAADVYALAVCAYWMTHGELPREAALAASADARDAVLGRALAADPAQRPGSAGELVEALRAACAA